jgi:hypothetical protein
MCKQLRKLGCEEGQPVYDSDRPGPADVPNTTCEQFCVTAQERGAMINPVCVSKAPTCDAVETYRAKAPSTCASN